MKNQESDNHSLLPTINDSKLIFIYIVAFTHFFIFSLVVIPINAKINETINGDANETSSRSSFVIISAYCIGQFAKLVSVKYNTAMADYIGRKPILMLSVGGGFIQCILFASSNSDAMFYIASFFAGYFDCFYNVCLAWISDIVEVDDRGKAFGILTGFSVGFGFALGIPIGAVLAETNGADTAFYISAAIHCMNFVVIFFIPINDTLSSVEKRKRLSSASDLNSPKTLTDSSSDSTSNLSIMDRIMLNRTFPTNISSFLIENSPASGITLIREAECPQDWLTNYLLQISQQILQTLFISFGIEVFGISVTETGALLAVLAVSTIAISPLLRNRFEEQPLAFWGAALQAVGYFFLSIAGTESIGAEYVGYPALFPLGVGSIWISALQTMLTKYYQKDRQGESTGVLSQQNVLAIIPAYPVCLLFSYTVQENGAKFKWPGVSFAFCVVFCLMACMCHYATHGSDGIFMIRKTLKADNKVKAAKAAEVTNMDVEYRMKL